MTDGEGLVVTVGLGVKVEVGVTLGSSVGEGVTEGVSLGVGEAVGLGVTDGVTEGAPTGSIAEAEFWGLDTFGATCLTKSTELLFVSSPFPANSSVPPVPISASKEFEEAFRSRLLLSIGLSNGVVSLVAEVPMPKRSIISF